MNIEPCSPTFHVATQQSQSYSRNDTVLPSGLMPKARITRRPGAIQPCTPCFRPQKVGTKQKGTQPTVPKAIQQTRPLPWAPVAWKHSVPVPKASYSHSSAGITEVDGQDGSQWWIARSLTLPAERRNGWVISWIIETHFNEEVVVKACEKAPCNQRMEATGMGTLVQKSWRPREARRGIAKAEASRATLLDELSQRLKIDAIAGSWKSHCSGVKCYAAFCDGVGHVPHFPCTEEIMERFTSIFSNAATLEQYVGHVKWVHRFLRMSTDWYTPSLKQCMRGVKKSRPTTPNRPALRGAQVRAMVRIARKQQDLQVAAILAVSRHFLLRVPSEALPMEWHGQHSKLELSATSCTLTLAKRKNRNTPTSLTRTCCCSDSGRSLCSVHWLLEIRRVSDGGTGVFSLNKSHLVRMVKELAALAGIDGAQQLGTHSLRRGMAQDILDMGGSLPTLLNAGGWASSAYLKYLRTSQTEDLAVAQAIMYLSDSEDEGRSILLASTAQSSDHLHVAA